ncbi:MAG TPA: nucleotide sugar dehydrogenase, partial [Vicinamibacterales bacterium]|nr:nucleotide sugar dehydrogenase [Vicinamibacterales bacterium]
MAQPHGARVLRPPLPAEFDPTPRRDPGAAEPDFGEICRRADDARRAGQEVVAVLGLGFVGTAVAANLARTESDGRPAFFVVGIDADSEPGREKCARLNLGIPPTYADDARLGAVIAAAAREPKRAIATVDSRALALADVVVSCINLDLTRAPFDTTRLSCDTDGYAEAMRVVGRHLRPGALVCIESTVPIGMCDRVIYPALCAGLREQGIDPALRRPLLAYCYERVMPGPRYLDSVNNLWRSYAGIDEASGARAEAFLSKFVNTKEFPLWRHKHTRAAEMAKLLENAYRAANIAFIEEWAVLAEAAGVDLFDIVRSIRVRKGTHDNMMFPGLGVGGYCLTKDALLACYGAERLLEAPAALPFSRSAIVTNERMPLRAVEMIAGHFGGALDGRSAAIVGVTYRPGVADTRSSPAEAVARALAARGVSVVAYDPLVRRWAELPEVPLVSSLETALARK